MRKKVKNSAQNQAFRRVELYCHVMTTTHSSHKRSLFPLYVYLSLTLLLLFFQATLKAQCASYPTFPGCSPAGSINLINAASVNAGQIHTCSSTTTLSSITLNGGTLIVCDNLTINAITVSSGTIFIKQGATLTLSNGGAACAFGANTHIYNYGKIDFKMSIVTGASNMLVNCLPSSIFSVAFDQFVLQGPNTYLINNGSFNSSYFIVQSTNAVNLVCMGLGSILKTGIMINQFNNSIYTPLGSAACINVTNMVINSSTVTASTGIHVCVPAGISIISGPNWGSAIVQTNCSACTVLLPVEFVTFSGHIENKEAILIWETLTEQNNCYYVLERSANGVDFLPIATLNGSVNSLSPKVYETRDNSIEFNTTYYYRLKQVDCDLSFTYSNIIDLNTGKSTNESATIYPNPTSNTFEIKTTEDLTIDKIELFNSLGELIITKNSIGTLSLENKPSGVYILKLSASNGNQSIHKIQKQ